ncbi:unnamed protein product [Effrenium voratum]|nr:unnamed protein product [Effrenium voratum]
MGDGSGGEAQVEEMALSTHRTRDRPDLQLPRQLEGQLLDSMPRTCSFPVASAWSQSWSCQVARPGRGAGACFSSDMTTSPTKMKSHGKTHKPSMLEFMGLAGNFSHLNLKDPFHVKKRGSTYQTEVRAGVTTFLAMAYILPVNSGMLSLVIPNMRQQLVCATALASFLGCWFMGILSNYPFMLAPGMGTNAFFTFSVCMGMGLTYEEAFAAVFCAGLIFMALSITGLRTLMIRLFPEGIKEPKKFCHV